MEEVGESSNENNIAVNGIFDFAASPHQVNKKAFAIYLVTDKHDAFRTRIGFNSYKLPQREFTLVVEFFVPDKGSVGVTTVDVNSTSLNIGQHLHKCQARPPEYIMIDLHGSITKGLAKEGHLIVYGVQGHVSDVNLRVFDTAFVIEGGKMRLI